MTRTGLLLLVLLAPCVGASQDPPLPGAAVPEALRLGSFEAAMAIADVAAWRAAAALLAEERDDARRLLARGIAEYVIGRDAAAVGSLVAALEGGADRAAACFHLGLAQRSSGRDEEALTALRCARDAAPEDLAVLEALARTQIETQRPVAALETLARAWPIAARGGREAERRVLLVLLPLLVSAGSDDVAAGARLLELAPSHARAHYWQALLLERAGGEGVEAALREAAALSEEPSLWVDVARVHRRRGETERARALLEGAAERAPEYAAPHELLGDHWNEAGRLAWALDAWRRAVHRDPTRRSEIVARITRLDAALARRFEASLAEP